MYQLQKVSRKLFHTDSLLQKMNAILIFTNKPFCLSTATI